MNFIKFILSDKKHDPNTGATVESGFMALPGGFRDSKGEFGYLGNDGVGWTSTEYDQTVAWAQSMFYDRVSIDNTYGNKSRVLVYGV